MKSGLADNPDVETAIKATGIKDHNWMQKLLKVDKEQLILIISQIANKANIDNKSIKEARTELPSFSAVKWDNFAVGAGLSKDPRYLELEYFALLLINFLLHSIRLSLKFMAHTRCFSRGTGTDRRGV
jgi:hypothetical protein